MTLHPAFGLFWQSPVLIMSLIGTWRMWRKSKYRPEAIVAILAFFSLLILYSGFYEWWGGWAFGPRYLIPMLTFLCLPLMFIPRRWFSGVIILGGISIMQMFIAVTTQVHVPEDWIHKIDQVGYFAYSSIYNYCLPLLLNGKLSNNIGIKLFNLNPWLSLVPPIAVLFMITLRFWVRHDSERVLLVQNKALIEE